MLEKEILELTVRDVAILMMYFAGASIIVLGFIIGLSEWIKKK